MARLPGTAVPGRKRGRPPKNRPMIDDSSIIPSLPPQTSSKQQQQVFRNGMDRSTRPTVATEQPRSAIIAYRRNNAHYRRSNTDGTTVSENVEEAPPQYPRRFPRVSGYYQIKDLPAPCYQEFEDGIAEGKSATSIAPAYSSERVCPILMSVDVPFRTQLEIEANEITFYDSGKLSMANKPKVRPVT